MANNSDGSKLSFRLVELVARFLDESGYPKTYKRFKAEAEGKSDSPSWRTAVNGPFDTRRPSLLQIVDDWNAQQALKQASAVKSNGGTEPMDGIVKGGDEESSSDDSDSSSDSDGGSDSDSTLATPEKKKAAEPVFKKEKASGQVKADGKRESKAAPPVRKEQKTGHVKTEAKAAKAAPGVSIEKKTGKEKADEKAPKAVHSASIKEQTTSKVNGKAPTKKGTEVLPPKVASAKPAQTATKKRKAPSSSSTSSSSDGSSSSSSDDDSGAASGMKKALPKVSSDAIKKNPDAFSGPVMVPSKGGPMVPLNRRPRAASTSTESTSSSGSNADSDSDSSDSGSSSIDLAIPRFTTSKPMMVTRPRNMTELHALKKRKRSGSPAPELSTHSKKARQASNPKLTEKNLNDHENTLRHTHHSSNNPNPESHEPKKVKKDNKNNQPFQRVPSNIPVDARFQSNAYQGYDYAERAHRDLAPTRGKQFTKEKNKKKRGSYRGGVIDTQGGRGIKFD